MKCVGCSVLYIECVLFIVQSLIFNKPRLKMKNLYLVVVLIFCLSSSGFSQKTWVSVHANSGYFFHKGAAARSNTGLHLSNVATIPNSTSSLYGNLGAVSYGLGISVQKTTAGRLVYGIEPSGESLASRQHIRVVSAQAGSDNTDEGNYFYRTSFLNFYPSIGRSINLIPKI